MLIGEYRHSPDTYSEKPTAPRGDGTSESESASTVTLRFVLLLDRGRSLGLRVRAGLGFPSGGLTRLGGRGTIDGIIGCFGAQGHGAPGGWGAGKYDSYGAADRGGQCCLYSFGLDGRHANGI